MKIEYSGQHFDVSHVISSLHDIVTPDRLHKIKAVIEKRSDQLAVVLENIYDRGNASAVMRSMEAFGYYQLHHIELQDTFKESARVTQGADKWLLQNHWQQQKACIEDLKAKGFKIYVTHLEGGLPIQEADFSTPVALCFGNEKDGASPELVEMAHEKVFIPMHGFVQSFNISVAAALCLQHIRQRHEEQAPKPLPDEKKAYLLARYLLKSCKNPERHLS